MQCGPIRHQITLEQTAAASLSRRLVIHDTSSSAGTSELASIQDVFRALVDDDTRTRAIGVDVLDAINRGRNCQVLTQWTDHLEHLKAVLRDGGADPLELGGRTGKKARSAVLAQLDNTAARGQLLLATGSYLGEGFDGPSLDTLFLAFPLSFKGRVVQSSDASSAPPGPRPTSKSTTTSIQAPCSARCSPTGSPPTTRSASTDGARLESGSAPGVEAGPGSAAPNRREHRTGQIY